MKKILIALLLIAAPAWAQNSPSNVSYMNGVGLHPEWAMAIDKLYSRLNGTNTFVGNQAITGTLTVSSNITSGGSIIITSPNTAFADAATSISAAGTTIVDAAQLVGSFNNVNVVGASSGVKLWTTTQTGTTVRVKNAGANDLKLYPPTTSDGINGGTLGAAVTLTTAAKQTATCTLVAANNWACSTQAAST